MFLIAFVCIASAFAFDDLDRRTDEIAAIGTRSIILQDADQAVTASTTFVATDLTTSVAASQKCKVRFFVPFTLAGTASGIKFQVNAPASPTAYVSSVSIIEDDGTVFGNVVTTEGAQGVTIDNAGNHLAIVEATVENGTTAGSVTLEFAQNVSDAGAATVLRGGTADIVKF